MPFSFSIRFPFNRFIPAIRLHCGFLWVNAKKHSRDHVLTDVALISQIRTEVRLWCRRLRGGFLHRGAYAAECRADSGDISRTRAEREGKRGVGEGRRGGRLPSGAAGRRYDRIERIDRVAPRMPSGRGADGIGGAERMGEGRGRERGRCREAEGAGRCRRLETAAPNLTTDHEGTIDKGRPAVFRTQDRRSPARTPAWQGS